MAYFNQRHLLVLSLTAMVKSDVTCDFSENGKSCEKWDLNSDIDGSSKATWNVWKGETPTSGTGPTSDHTNGSDYYIYLETSHRKYGDAASFSTPYLISRDTYVNVTFWYFMYGSLFGSLKAYSKSINNVTYPVWSQNSNKGENWLFVSRIVSLENPFKIVFRGIVGSQFSDIAVDDINIFGADYFQDKDLTSRTTEESTTITLGASSVNKFYIQEVALTTHPSFIIAASCGGAFWMGILFLLFCYVRLNKKNQEPKSHNQNVQEDIQNEVNQGQIYTEIVVADDMIKPNGNVIPFQPDNTSGQNNFKVCHF